MGTAQYCLNSAIRYITTELGSVLFIKYRKQHYNYVLNVTKKQFKTKSGKSRWLHLEPILIYFKYIPKICSFLRKQINHKFSLPNGCTTRNQKITYVNAWSPSQ